jgi:hypothetical protein
MSFLKLHHISFRIVAVAYAMPLKDPLPLRRINTTSEVKHRAPHSGNAFHVKHQFYWSIPASSRRQTGRLPDSYS